MRLGDAGEEEGPSKRPKVTSTVDSAERDVSYVLEVQRAPHPLSTSHVLWGLQRGS